VGLLVGNPEAETSTILLGLDPDLRLLDEALARGADTVITHHPCIFHPLSTIITTSPAGIFLEKALTHKINCIACHTNLDHAANGVSDALAWALGLTSIVPLRPGIILETGPTGLGRLGNLDPPLSGPAFINRLLRVLQLDTIQIAGKLPELIKTVALCAGSGSELAETARSQGADLYLSAEIKHHTARWAEACDFCVIDGSHYGTEQPVLPILQRQIQKLADANNWPLEILVSQTQQHPFASVHKNTFA
jgi:dinuclear metal center YbgI/SA1388 family protein